jgi:PIN domain nuclease of toxin-antitoxin system
VLDTHIWIWWVSQDSQLSPENAEAIRVNQPDGLVVSAISCWEVAKLVERGRLTLARPVLEWIDAALQYQGVQLMPLTPRISVESTQLPPPFHRDPADQIIVATARVLNCALLTDDTSIRAYPHVRLLP